MNNDLSYRHLLKIITSMFSASLSMSNLKVDPFQAPHYLLVPTKPIKATWLKSDDGVPSLSLAVDEQREGHFSSSPRNEEVDDINHFRQESGWLKRRRAG